MKIVQDYTAVNVPDVEIISAEYRGDYKVGVSFSDGTVRLIDFQPFLSKSFHPSISKYLDKSLFEQFKITNGNLNWNDYDLIFPVEDLYKGKII
jgi:uncharacterized protein DUF2442